MIALLLLALVADSASTLRRIPLAPGETLTVTVATPAAPSSPAVPIVLDTAATPAAPALLTLAPASPAPRSLATAPIPIVLLPGLLGGAFGYRNVAPALVGAIAHPPNRAW